MRVPLYVPGPRARRAVAFVMWGAVVLVLLGIVRFFAFAVGVTRDDWIGAGIALLAATILIWAFVVRPARKRGGVVSPAVEAAERVERPVPVPTRVDGPVSACMRCGSRDLSMPSFR